MLVMTMISFYTSIGGLIKAEMFPAEIRALGVELSKVIKPNSTQEKYQKV